MNRNYELQQRFLDFVKNYHLKNRPQVIELLDRYSDKKIYVFKNRSEANDFLKII